MYIGTYRAFINASGKIAGAAIFMLAAAVLISNFYYRNNPEYLPGIGPYKMLLVLSDSMKPVFAAGDVIIVNTSGKSGYGENDIVTFWRSKTPPLLLTHRITGAEKIAGQVYYSTRGDANNTADGAAVRQDQILGKYLFKIPYGGHVVNFVHTGPGFTLLILVPFFITAVHELKNYRLKKRTAENKRLDNHINGDTERSAP